MHVSLDPNTFQKFQNKRSCFTALLDRSNLRREMAQASRNDAHCYKVAYGSKSEANSRLRQINSKSGTMKTLRNAYRCPHCESWHLTSGPVFRKQGVRHG